MFSLASTSHRKFVAASAGHALTQRFFGTLHKVLTPVFPEAVDCGQVVNVRVRKNEEVKEDDLVMVLETVKLPIPIYSPVAGVVREFHASDVVVTGDPLFTVEATEQADKPKTTVRRPPQMHFRLSAGRRAAAANLLAAQRDCALLTTFNEVDLTEVMAFRKSDAFFKIGVGLGSVFASVVGRTLANHPYVNASLVKDPALGETVVRFNSTCDVAMAFASPKRGLLLPTFQNCHLKSVRDVDADVNRVRKTIAKGDKPKYEDMAPATFTVSNGGAFGSLMGTPILVPPQVAILGMHAIKQRPVAVNGKVEIRPMMYLALTYDHRWLDGKDSVTFLKDVVDALESPVCLNALLSSKE